MPVDTPSKRPLTQLNFEIEEAEAEAARLELDRASISRIASRALRRLQFLRLARGLRSPTASFDFWPILLLTVGSGVVAVLAFILTHLVFDSVSIALLGLLVGLASGVVLFATLLYKPPNVQLPATIAEAESHLRLLEARLKEKVERITDSKMRLNRLLEERRDQIASGKLQKAALLQRKWKTMQETEWQDFVVEVCRTLGAKVERIGRSGGDDANLIADFGSRRVAVFTEAKDHNVTSATIQLALAAKTRHNCDSCGVILNRRFTGAAQDFAQRNGCLAIGTGEFPDFVLGKLEL
jgi:HJR/Mrr/RecB family endonuclease